MLDRRCLGDDPPGGCTCGPQRHRGRIGGFERRRSRDVASLRRLHDGRESRRLGDRRAAGPGGHGSSKDVYLRSFLTDTTHLLSIGPAGGNGAFAAELAAMSDDGSRVMFTTSEPLVPGDTDTSRDLYERTGAATTLVSTGPAGGNGPHDVLSARVSPDGAHVFFETNEQLVAADTFSGRDLYERVAGATSLVSAGPAGGGCVAAFVCFHDVSDDGSRVSFLTDKPLTAGDTDSQYDAYARSGGTTTLLSPGSAAFPAFFGGVSADGTKVVFNTEEQLVAADTDALRDAYLNDNGTVSLISTGPSPGPDAAAGGWLAQDGSRAWFTTNQQMTADDTDAGKSDIYERRGSTTRLVTKNTPGRTHPYYNDPLFAGASSDGERVVFVTENSLTPDDTDPPGGCNEDVDGDYFSRGCRDATCTTRSATRSRWCRPGRARGSLRRRDRRHGDLCRRDARRVHHARADPRPGCARLFWRLHRYLRAHPRDDATDVLAHARADGRLRRRGVVRRRHRVRSRRLGGQAPLLLLYRRGSSHRPTPTRPSTSTSRRSPSRAATRDRRARRRSSPRWSRHRRRAPRRTARTDRRSPSPSCAPPQTSSPNLTVGGSGGASPARSSGYVRFHAPFDTPGPPDAADASVAVVLTNVMRSSDFSDYTGELRATASIRITDRDSPATSRPRRAGLPPELDRAVRRDRRHDGGRHLLGRDDVRLSRAGACTGGHALGLRGGPGPRARRRPGREARTHPATTRCLRRRGCSSREADVTCGVVCLALLLPAGAQAAFPGANGKIPAFTRAHTFVMNPNGSGVTDISPSGSLDRHPAWSADGTKIAVSRTVDHGANFDIYVMNADGSGVTRVPHPHRRWTNTPPGLRTAGEIVFTRAEGDSNCDLIDCGDIFTVNADGTGLQPVSASEALDLEPAWSPDGEQIAFERAVGCIGFGGYCRGGLHAHRPRRRKRDDALEQWRSERVAELVRGRRVRLVFTSTVGAMLYRRDFQDRRRWQRDDAAHTQHPGPCPVARVDRPGMGTRRDEDRLYGPLLRQQRRRD